MNESVKTFSLVIITVCVFIITIIDVVNLVNRKSQLMPQGIVVASPMPSAASSNPNTPASSLVGESNTTVKFFETQFDFGTIKQGEVVKHNFEFMNTGTVPLLIQNAVSSCGCTVPSYPKDPLAPGAKGTIEVQFNSANKNGLVNKNVTVTANTDPPTNVLNITANVENK